MTLSDPQPALDAAREAAFADARHQAEQLAALAGRTLGGVRRVSCRSRAVQRLSPGRLDPWSSRAPLSARSRSRPARRRSPCRCRSASTWTEPQTRGWGYTGPGEDGMLPGMTCASCGTAAGPGAKFCAECGSPLASGCPGCGADVTPGAKFCPSCGTPLRAAARPPQPRTEATGDLGRAGPPGAGGRAAAGVRPVRGPGGLHRAVRVARRRRGPRAALALLRGLPQRGRAARRCRGEVHRRRGDGGLGRSGRQRGRRRAGGAVGARAGGGRPGDGRGRGRDRAAGARRRAHRRGRSHPGRHR